MMRAWNEKAYTRAESQLERGLPIVNERLAKVNVVQPDTAARRNAMARKQVDNQVRVRDIFAFIASTRSHVSECAA
jgi:hypothetical protein